MKKNNDKVLQVDGVSCERNYIRILRDISFSINEGQILLIRGKNGSGKTSLLKIIAGILSFTGTIIFRDDVKNLGYVGHKNAIKLNDTVEQHIIFWKNLYNSGKEVSNVINIFKLHDIYDLPVYFLSFGQKKKLCFVRLYLLGSKLWLLDEPLTGLDKNNKLFISNMLSNHANNGGAAILTTHEVSYFPKNNKVKELFID